MAIDPNLLVIKPINQIQTASDPLSGQALIYDGGNELKKASLQSIKDSVSSGIKGEAITTTVPTPWTSGDPDLYEKYDVKTAGTFTNFKDLNNASIVVTSDDLDGNLVQFWITNGVTQKVIKALPEAENLTYKQYIQLISNGDLTDINDITPAGRVLELLSDGIKINSGAGLAGINFQAFSRTLNHHYIVLLDYTPITPYFSIRFFVENSALPLSIEDIPTPLDAKRKVITAVFDNVDTNTSPLVMQLQPEQDMILHKIMIFDAGLNGADLTVEDALKQYETFGWFYEIPLVKAAEIAEVANSFNANEQSIRQLKDDLFVGVDLSNFTICFNGDSITNLGFARKGIDNSFDGFIYLLSKAIGIPFENLINRGVGGNRLAIPQGGNDGTDAGGGQPAICVRQASMPYADMYVVMAGSNDIANSIVVHGSEATKNDKTTIYGATYATIKATRENNPQGKLLWIIPPRRIGGRYGNNDLFQITDTIRKCLEYYGVPYIDFFQKLGANDFTIQSNTNLFQGVTWSENSDINSSGAVVAGSKFVSNYITIESAKTYFIGEGALNYYTSGNVFISKQTFAPNAANESKPPLNASKVRAVVNTLGSGNIDGSVVDLFFGDIAGDYISDGVHLNALGNINAGAYSASEFLKYIFKK